MSVPGQREVDYELFHLPPQATYIIPRAHSHQVQCFALAVDAHQQNIRDIPQQLKDYSTIVDKLPTHTVSTLNTMTENHFFRMKKS